MTDRAALLFERWLRTATPEQIDQLTDQLAELKQLLNEIKETLTPNEHTEKTHTPAA